MYHFKTAKATINGALLRRDMRTFRTLNELSQKSLGEVLGISASAVSKIECQEREPSSSQLAILSVLMNVHPNTYFEFSDIADAELFTPLNPVQMELL